MSWRHNWEWDSHEGPGLVLTFPQTLDLWFSKGMDDEVACTRIGSLCPYTHPVPQGMGDFLERHIRQAKHNLKISKGNEVLISFIKKPDVSMDTIKEVKRQPTDSEKIVANHIFE